MPDSTSTYAQFYYKQSRRDAFPKFGPKPMDVHYEKLHYGKVDQKQYSVYMTDPLNLSQLQPGQPHVALDFVADAFGDLQRYFSKAVSLGRLHKRGKFYKGIEARGGWRDVNTLYSNWLVGIYAGFEAYLLAGDKPKNQEIRSFGDYVDNFINYVSAIASDWPITKTGWIKSRHCPANISGLIVDISRDPFSDEEVTKRWLQDPNFVFYRNAAIKHGFLVTKNAPWRLYANVASVEMQNYWTRTIEPTPEQVEIARNAGWTDAQIIQSYRKTSSKKGLVYSPGNASNLFNLYYNRSYKYDILELMNSLGRYYNRFVQRYPTVTILKPTSLSCATPGSVDKTVIFRSRVDLAEVERVFLPLGIPFYIFLRASEESIFGYMDPKRFDRIVEKSAFLLKKVDLDKAMLYINKSISRIASQKAAANPEFCQNYQSCNLQAGSLVDYTYVKEHS